MVFIREKFNDREQEEKKIRERKKKSKVKPVKYENKISKKFYFFSNLK